MSRSTPSRCGLTSTTGRPTSCDAPNPAGGGCRSTERAPPRAAYHARMLPDARRIEDAVTLLDAGKLVAFPTETVYGLGADAANAFAVACIFAAKGRPASHPLIVHFSN